MKRIVKLAVMGAIVLSAASCQREPAITDSQPQSEIKEVSTQFVLNVTAAPTTKQSADVVQQNRNFRGIQDARLYTYKTGMSGVPYVLNTSAPAADNVKTFDLGTLMTANAISNGDGDNNGVNDNLDKDSKRVLQLSIPVGVDAVLMYGKAIKAANSSNYEYGATLDYDYHLLEPEKTISSTPGETRFYALQILNESNLTKYDATASLMIAVINDVLSRKVEAAATADVGPVGHKVTFHNLPELSWSELGHQYEIDKYGDDARYEDNTANKTNHVILGRPVEGLEEVLGKCYYLFTYIKPSDIPYPAGSQEWIDFINTNFGGATVFAPLGEYRAGSSFAVKKMIIDMYKIIKASSETIPTNEKEANASRLAEVILGATEQYFNTTDGTYKGTAVIKSALGTKWSSDFEIVTDLNDYPGQFGVPEGAAQLGFNVQGADDGDGGTYAQDEFYYYDPNHPLVNPLMTEFNPQKYLYPAELWYYVNSPIRTTDDDVTMANYPSGVTPWNDNVSWTADHWTFPGKVASATRGVAVANSLNYGVALLKSEISTTASSLQDNRAALTEETTNNSIPVSGSQISLRGVLVGGVNPRMNWQFIRYHESGSLSLFDGVIYDHATGNPVLPTGSNTIVNYTLVYDNYNSSEAANNQNDVYVALEFENGGAPFWGRDNLIPTGGVFYLVGKLPKPTADQITSLSSKWPTDHQIPPVYGVDGATDYSGSQNPGESKKIARVFIQDFMTTAHFRIGEKSLQKAYYSVPDLRASQMSLGLSVDLQWTSGLDYIVNF